MQSLFQHPEQKAGNKNTCPASVRTCEDLRVPELCWGRGDGGGGGGPPRQLWGRGRGWGVQTEAGWGLEMPIPRAGAEGALAQQDGVVTRLGAGVSEAETGSGSKGSRFPG